ncbi:hypothetical protein LCGC14_0305750 [marine sediment metagenome]|uniref:Uncharacterized protein n=1 Tax=marine sediment metagenome TaxID=412755 RepID=A0A0F9WAI4_9ZZZZ
MASDVKVKRFRLKKEADRYVATFKLLVPVTIVIPTQGKKVNRRELKKNLKTSASNIANLTANNFQNFLQAITAPKKEVIKAPRGGIGESRKSLTKKKKNRKRR